MAVVFNPTDFRSQITNPSTGNSWFGNPPTDAQLTSLSDLAFDALPEGFLDKLETIRVGLGKRTLNNATAHVVTQFLLANPAGGGGGGYNINSETTGSVSTNFTVPSLTNQEAWWSTSTFGQLVLSQINRFRANRYIGGQGIDWGRVAK